MLYLSIRSVLTGHLSEIRSVGDDIGAARREAIALAETMLANSVWLTTGNPTSRYSSILETFPACKVPNDHECRDIMARMSARLADGSEG